MLNNFEFVVPSAPRNFAVAGIEDSLILATAYWEEPEHPNGIITLYEITCFTFHHNLRRHYVFVRSPDTLDLYRNTTHNCSIQARTRVGLGEPSDAVTVRSGQHCK